MIHNRSTINSILTYLFIIAFLIPVKLIAGSTPDDPEITEAVNTELLIQRGTYASLVDVETTEGIVTLEGTVNNLLEKERSARVAKSVKGVVGVINEIEIKAPEVDDFTLEQDIENAWLHDPATDSYELHASANEGTVTLTGTVQSWQEKQLACRIAKGVRGVEKEIDKINIVYSPNERPDYEIKREVEAVLDWDVFLYDELIDVAVKNGKVKLTGSVGSAREREMARSDAWVAGVKEVNSDKLRVKPWVGDSETRDQKVAMKSDAKIKKAVEATFLYDPRVLSFNPVVDVNQGIVTLTGVVDNLESRKAAEQDARNVVGVLRVKNYLKVRPDLDLSDETIENNVEWILRKDPYVEKYEVSVEVINGIAYLSGDVDNEFERLQANSAAGRAKGVIAVVNNLDISPIYNTTNHGYYAPFHQYSWNAKADWEIQNDVRSQIWWSPFVDGSEVSIDVEDGNVELTGTVDSWRERFAAEKNAFEGGALSVSNQLKIENNVNDE